MSDKIERVSVQALDDILGKKFSVLDSGFIRVCDYIGGDDAIVQAARVSCGKGTKKSLEDEELIRYLMRHDHLTPFEMASIKLHIRIPMDCWRQYIRHRTAKVNEQSSRYSIMDDGRQITSPDQWRLQSKNNKQGSNGFVEEEQGRLFSEKEKELHEKTYEFYNQQIEFGVAREQARKNLPLCQYTEAYWKIDLRNLFNFLYLRMDSHAQLEIREYANVIANEIVSKWVPVAWNAFLDYKKNAIVLSAREIEIMQSETAFLKIGKAKQFGWIQSEWNPRGTEKMFFNLERKECETKLKTFGINDPWGIEKEKELKRFKKFTK